MSVRSKRLGLNQLDQMLSGFREACRIPSPTKGWIRAIRSGLGMTAQQLGARTGMSQAAIAQIEKSEAKKTASIATMEKMAKGLDCRFVYGLVPNTTLEETLKARVRKIARREILRTAHSMAIEKQGIPNEQTQKQIDILTEEIMATLPRYIWDENDA